MQQMQKDVEAYQEHISFSNLGEIHRGSGMSKSIHVIFWSSSDPSQPYNTFKQMHKNNHHNETHRCFHETPYRILWDPIGPVWPLLCIVAVVAGASLSQCLGAVLNASKVADFDHLRSSVIRIQAQLFFQRNYFFDRVL